MIFEAHPRAEQWGAYLRQAKILRPELEQIDGFVENVRYRSLTREVVTIPHDPAMVDGVLRYSSLRPATQRAWLGAGAAVARGL